MFHINILFLSIHNDLLAGVSNRENQLLSIEILVLILQDT
jgi:hypothetical protein